jgi:hypothetical protein
MLRIIQTGRIARRCMAMQIRMFTAGKGSDEFPTELK